MERFKMICRSEDGVIFYTEIEAEEVLRIRGFRFFAHRYYGTRGLEWRISCAQSGAAIGWSPFYDDALKMASDKLINRFDTYIKSLKKRPRAKWRYKGA